MIPKVIHYCWFGKNKKGDIVKKCLQTWKEELPDYKIKCWNEDNFPICNPFVRQAYQNKKWAFVADYARLYALSNEGGIYLDTDMFIIKSFDDLLSNKCFIGFEDADHINAAIVGSVKGHPFINACLQHYESLDFDTSFTIPKVMTSVIKKYGYLKSNVHQSISEVEVFPTSYFYPYPYSDSFLGKDFRNYIKPETYAVHLWDVSWADNRTSRLLKQGRWTEWFKIFIKSPFKEIKNYRKIYSSINEHLKAK